MIFSMVLKTKSDVMTMDVNFRLFLETEDGAKPFEKCTKEEIKAFSVNASKRLSKTLSQYYTQHPEEMKQI